MTHCAKRAGFDGEGIGVGRRLLGGLRHAGFLGLAPGGGASGSSLQRMACNSIGSFSPGPLTATSTKPGVGMPVIFASQTSPPKDL